MRRISFMLALIGLLFILAYPVLAQDGSPISGLQIVLSVDLKPSDIKTEDVKAAAQIVARRLDAIDIHPYVVQVLAGKAIQVQIPSVDDPQPIIDALTETAMLELVDFSGLRDRTGDFMGSTIITTAWQADPNLPPRDAGQMNPLTDKPFETVLMGDAFSVAVAIHSQTGQWEVGFTLTPEASQTFGDFTGSHINEPLAIVLDGKVISVPVIQARMSDGGIIQGNFTEEEAKRLAAEIQAGLLPIPLKATSIVTIEAVTPE